MANTRSARKRIRGNERKRIRNRAVRSAVRTKVARARRALLAAGAEAAPTEQDLRDAIRALDRAAEKGILHRNNASRRKSRLAVMAARLAKASSGEAGEQAAARSAAAGGAKGRSAKPATRKSAASGGTKPVAKRATKTSAKSTAAAGAKSPAKSTAKSSARTS